MIRTDNNFDFLRFVGALLVVWGHSYAFSAGLPAPAIWGQGIHVLGLIIFFCISGYLVTESWHRTQSPSRFFKNRALRIFPALIVCVAFSALVLGPAVTRLSLADYFGHALVWKYFETAALHIRFHLPGVFEQNSNPAVNGSLWSLPVEFACYILLAALGVLAVRARLALAVIIVFVAAIAGCMYMTFMYSGERIVIYGTEATAALRLMPYFFAGSLFSIFRNRISFRLDVALGCVALLSFATTLRNLPILMLSCWLLLPYVVLTIGNARAPFISDWGQRFGDLSYGIYLFGAPMQQLVAHLNGGRVSVEVMLVASTIAATAFGWLSWNFIERPALSLKHIEWGPVVRRIGAVRDRPKDGIVQEFN